MLERQWQLHVFLLAAGSQVPKSHFVHANMAEFGTVGAGLREEDRRALKEGKKLLKKALGAAGVGGLLKGGKSKEKLRREKQRRREAEARAGAERRATMAAQRAELHQRATAEREQRAAAERERRQAAEIERERRGRQAAERRRQAAERELERGGFADASGLFGGVAGGVAACARGAELREARQEVEQRRAELAVAAAREVGRERAFADELAAAHATTNAAAVSRHDEADAAARAEAEAEYARRERDAAAASLAAEREAREAAEKKAQYATVGLQAQVERSNAYHQEQRALHERGRLTEAKLTGTEAELSRLAAELEQTRVRVEAQRSRAQFYVTEAQRSDASRTQASCIPTAPPETPTEPFHGLHTFSVGTSPPPRRGKAGRRILKAKRPPRAG